MSKFYGYIGEFPIRTSEIDAQKRIKVDSLIQLMQETSMQNVLSLKLSVWDLEDKALSWGLLKKEIHVHSYPSVGERGLLDTTSRRLIKIPPYEFYDVIPDNQLDRPSFTLSDKIEEQHSITFNILWRHLDWNNHVNNIVLVEKMLDVIPAEFLYLHSLKRLSIQFKTESILGDELVSTCEIKDQEVSHVIKRIADGATIALAKSIWTT